MDNTSGSLNENNPIVIDSRKENPVEDYISERINEIAQFIERDQCILILGPNVSDFEESNSPVMIELSKHLAKRINAAKRIGQNKGNNFNIDSENLLEVCEVFLDKFYSRTSLKNQIINFFRDRNLRPGKILNAIAKIPFSLIINTSFDHLIKEAYGNAHFDYYHKDDGSRRDPPDGKPSKPLIYNLFGSIIEPKSLVITELDKIKLVENVISEGAQIAKNIHSQLKDSDKVFLAIGFDFNEWYLRFLLRILKLDNENNKNFGLGIEGSDTPVDGFTSFIFEKNYYLYIVNYGITDFIEKINKKLIINGNYPPGLPTENNLNHVKVFIANSLSDEKHVNELAKRLVPLEDDGIIKYLNDSKDKYKESKQNFFQKLLEEADVIIVLVSADLSADPRYRNTILNEEKYKSLKAKGKKFLFTFVRSTIFDYQFIEEKFTLTKEGEVLPIEEWPSIDRAYVNVIRELKKIIY